MLIYGIRRLLLLPVMLLGIAVITFMAIHLAPGDPITGRLQESGLSTQQLAELKSHYGLDKPLHVQLMQFLTSTARGDLGRSIITNAKVADEILQRFPSTFQLAMGALLIAVVLGVPLGVMAAVARLPWVDSALMVGALLGVSVPSFWLGLMLILFFGVNLGWFPVLGGEGLRALVLPALTLGLGSAAVIARLTRSAMLEVLHQDYIRTARAKGLRESVVAIRHALRNSLISVVTVLGIQIGYLLTGTVIIETVFARAGIGSVAIRAIQGRDFPLVQGIVLFYAVIFVATNLLVDMLYGLLDPRIRQGGEPS